VVDEHGVSFSTAVNGEEPVRGSRLVGSIRRDRISVSKARDCAMASAKVNSLLGEVHAIEYQGSYVKVTIERPSGEEFVANIIDSDFFRDPLDIGDSVLARWSAQDVLILEGAADAVEASMGEVGGVLI
jgi:putative spermidine/putrescine transport system ATP-binding protein